MTPGDIVKFMAPIAGYEKYHVFLGANEHDVLLFLYINSENGYSGDLNLVNADFPCIPCNANGQSVVSFSMLARVSRAKLTAMPHTVCGRVSPAVVEKLAAHCPTVKTLPRSEKLFVIASVEQM